MKLPPSILDDIKHATDILGRDTTPVWHLGAAAMLRGIADQIEARAEAQAEADRKAETKPQP